MAQRCIAEEANHGIADSCALADRGQAIAAPFRNVMSSRRLIASPAGQKSIVAAQSCTGKGWTCQAADVRFESEADIVPVNHEVRSPPESGH
jgi:hypothetical protein